MVEYDARSGDSALDQWFTPFWAAEQLVEDALRHEGRVSCLEPACGTGAFLAAIPSELPAIGIDIDPLVIPAAHANSGREILLGDFRTVDLVGYSPELIIGNPPFDSRMIDAFLDRAHHLLPEGGLVALILPSTIYRTRRIARLSERFALDINLIPKTLFGRLEYPLTWAKLRKGRPRTFSGLMLFAEQHAVEQMRDHIREAVERPGTWRVAVEAALASLGGAAALPAIYDAITPERRRDRPFWQEKVRQILQRHCEPIERGRWALKAAA